eukprot:3537931-Rhodomonas_salina.4
MVLAQDLVLRPYSYWHSVGLCVGRGTGLAYSHTVSAYAIPSTHLRDARYSPVRRPIGLRRSCYAAPATERAPALYQDGMGVCLDEKNVDINARDPAGRPPFLLAMPPFMAALPAYMPVLLWRVYYGGGVLLLWRGLACAHRVSWCVRAAVRARTR